jgi:hypothetical protein
MARYFEPERLMFLYYELLAKPSGSLRVRFDLAAPSRTAAALRYFVARAVRLSAHRRLPSSCARLAKASNLSARVLHLDGYIPIAPQRNILRRIDFS